MYHILGSPGVIVDEVEGYSLLPPELQEEIRTLLSATGDPQLVLRHQATPTSPTQQAEVPPEPVVVRLQVTAMSPPQPQHCTSMASLSPSPSPCIAVAAVIAVGGAPRAMRTTKWLRV